MMQTPAVVKWTLHDLISTNKDMVYITSPKAVSFTLLHPVEQLILQGWTTIHAHIEFVDQNSDKDKGAHNDADYDDIKFHLPRRPEDIVPGQLMSELLNERRMIVRLNPLLCLVS